MWSVGVYNECGYTNVPISLVLRNSCVRAAPFVGSEDGSLTKNNCSSDVYIKLEWFGFLWPHAGCNKSIQCFVLNIQVNLCS